MNVLHSGWRESDDTFFRDAKLEGRFQRVYIVLGDNAPSKDHRDRQSSVVVEDAICKQRYFRLRPPITGVPLDNYLGFCARFDGMARRIKTATG